MACTPWDRGLLEQFLEFLGPHSRHTFRITNAKGSGEILCDDPNMEDPHVARYVSRNDAFILRSDRLARDGRSQVLQLVCSGTVERMKALRARADSFHGIDRIKVSRTVYPARDFELVDIVARGADKGSGLSALARILNVAPIQIMAIGDNYADSTMLEIAGYPVVMRNAPEEMRRHWPVTGTNDENGVAQVIERFILS